MRLPLIAKLLLPQLKRIAASREPDFRIVKDAESITGEITRDAIYLERWWMRSRNDRMNVYLHHYIRDDDAALHDHQYGSVSLVMAEGLRETYQEDPPRSESLVRYPQPGDLVFRSSRMAHRLQVLPGSDPWTLFITGPRVKETWGFWCGLRFVPWTDYTKVSQTAGRGTGTSGVGVGCGEEDQPWRREL